MQIDTYIINSIRTIEKEKLYYYMLCRTNDKPVVVIESPISENKKDKSEQNFLGYSWSTAKGREGIHYITSNKSNPENSSTGKSKDIKAIITPLFNPLNPYDENKINSIIRHNFNGDEVVIPDNLKEFVSLIPLQDMIDFNHIAFDESINIVPQHQIDIDTDCNCVVLDKFVYLNEFTKNPNKSDGEIIYVDISSVEKNTGIISYNSLIAAKNAPSRARRIAKNNSILISTVRPNLRGFAFVEKEVENAIYSTGFAILRSRDEEVLNPKYIYYMFMYLDVIMAQMKAMMPKGAYPSINADDIKRIRIPLPTPQIQKAVIEEIEKVEKDFQTSRMNIESLDKKVMSVFLKHKVVNTKFSND